MPSGFIYFAATSNPSTCKVGRCARQDGLTGKEKEYRRLDPHFRILYHYATDDVTAEEARVLKHLRLVSSTKIAGAGREVIPMPPARAFSLASNIDLDEKRREARDALMAHPLGFEDFSVADALIEANRLDRETDFRSIARSAELCDALGAVGFTVIAADPQLALSAQIYLYVHDPKKLVKNLPGLRPYLPYLEQGATFG